MRARQAFQSRVEDVARRRGQWPLPVAVAGGAWRRTRAALRSWRDSLARAGADAANALWRAEGLLGGLGAGLQAAAVAVTAAGTLLASPAAASASMAQAAQIPSRVPASPATPNPVITTGPSQTTLHPSGRAPSVDVGTGKVGTPAGPVEGPGLTVSNDGEVTRVSNSDPAGGSETDIGCQFGPRGLVGAAVCQMPPPPALDRAAPVNP
jgi:hypothetical protein